MKTTLFRNLSLLILISVLLTACGGANTGSDPVSTSVAATLQAHSVQATVAASLAGGTPNPGSLPAVTPTPFEAFPYQKWVEESLNGGEVPLYANATPCPNCGPRINVEEEGMVFVDVLPVRDNYAYSTQVLINNAYVKVMKSRGLDPDLYHLVHLLSLHASQYPSDGGTWYDCDFARTGGCVVSISSGSIFMFTDIANQCVVGKGNGANLEPFQPHMGGYGLSVAYEGTTVELRQGKFFKPAATNLTVAKSKDCWAEKSNGAQPGDVDALLAAMAGFKTPQDAVGFGVSQWDVVKTAKQNFANDHSFSTNGETWVLFTDLKLTGGAVPACLTPLTGKGGASLTDYGYGAFKANGCSDLNITQGVGYELP